MLHKHSTLAAAAAAIVIGVLVGAVTRWSAIAIVPCMLVAFLILPRLFFGLKASRAVDKDDFEEGSDATLLSLRDMGGLTSSSTEFDLAYAKATDTLDPDPTALAKLAEEEYPDRP